MNKKYLIYGISICLLFSYASYAGWNVAESLKSGKWNPKGRSSYHK